jgi:glycosyltransferase involved in cell wall biosynthesis
MAVPRKKSAVRRSSKEPLRVQKKRQSPKLSIIVCTYQRYASLQRTIESLMPQILASPDVELLIIDNSADQAAAKSFGARYHAISHIRYILEPKPGLSNARNVGCQAAKGEYVAYLDDDVIVGAGWARAILSAFAEAGPQAGVVGGRVRLAWPAPRPKWMHDNMLGYLGLCELGDKLRALRKGENLVGCNIAYRRQCLIDVGGFSIALGRNGDAGNLLSNEELEVARLITNVGSKQFYAPEAVVEHVIDESRLTKTWFRRRFAWQAVSDAMAKPDDLAMKIMRAKARLAVTKPIQSVISKLSEWISDTDPALKFYLEIETTYDRILLGLSES